MMVTLPQWLAYVEAQIGFILPKYQHRWVENAILTTATEHNLSVAYLWIEVQKNQIIKQQLLDEVLILESRFFRHTSSITFITELARMWQMESYQLSTDKTLKDSSDEFRIWSVGCSEGQEAWSIAMSLAKQNIQKFHIIGSDISTKAIESAKKSTYDSRYLEGIPESYQEYVKPIKDERNNPEHKQGIELQKGFKNDSQQWQIDTKLKKNVTFILNNIFLPHHDLKQPQTSSYFLRNHNVIICQNMLIYFRQFDQRDILNRLVSQCVVGGHIVLAPGELMFWNHPQMQRIEDDSINAWKKVK